MFITLWKAYNAKYYHPAVSTLKIAKNAGVSRVNDNFLNISLQGKLPTERVA